MKPPPMGSTSIIMPSAPLLRTRPSLPANVADTDFVHSLQLGPCQLGKQKNP